MPQFVLEVLSETTAYRDRTVKREIYRRLGVEEYWMYDPHGGLLPNATGGVQAERLNTVGSCTPIEPESTGWPRSSPLGLELRDTEHGLLFWDPITRVLLDPHMDVEEVAATANLRTAEEQRLRLEKERQAAEDRRLLKQAELKFEDAERRIDGERRLRLEEAQARRALEEENRALRGLSPRTGRK